MGTPIRSWADRAPGRVPRDARAGARAHERGVEGGARAGGGHAPGGRTGAILVCRPGTLTSGQAWSVSGEVSRMSS